MAQKYRSFQEIDEHLQILKLQREIDKESLKLRLNRTKTDLFPQKLVQGMGMTLTRNGAWKSLFLAFAIKKVLRQLEKTTRRKPINQTSR